VHYIQRKILGKLLYADALSYAAMKPHGVESNHYAYHLEQLQKEGLVKKHDKLYALSPRGLHVIDRMSQEVMVERLQPHIVTAIDITNAQGQTLLFKRSFQPYIHRFGFPLGKIHYEEDIYRAAERELYEKTSLTGVPLRQRGMVYVEASQEGTVISKILCHVFDGVLEGAPRVTPDLSHRGESVWLDHRTLTANDTMPGFFAIKKLFAGTSDALFFAELQENLP
jgi:8-oxo-dGTP pyrophosphatase MutT (NUDIX family)